MKRHTKLIIVVLALAGFAYSQSQVVIQNGAGQTGAATVSSNMLKVDASGATVPTTVSGSVTVAGTVGITGDALTSLQAIETAVEDTSAVPTIPTAHTSGGCIGDTSSILAGNSVNETAVKASAGQVYSVSVFHINDAPLVFRLYNDTTANIDETDTPIYRMLIPANATAALGAGAIDNFGAAGMQFSTAITYRITKGIADNSTTALDASEAVINVCYK